MITCKYSSKTKKHFLICFLLQLLPFFCLVFMLLKEMFLCFFNFNKELGLLICICLIIICFFPIIICSIISVSSFKTLNYYKHTIFEIWDNQLICNYKNKETVINYKDINYLIYENKKNDMAYIDSINYGNNKKILFRSFCFENKENADILMSYFEITKTEPYWFLWKKVFVKVKEII